MIDKNHDGKITLDEFLQMHEQNQMPGLMSWLSQTAASDNDHVFEEVQEPESYQKVRDERLAKSDTRRFCLDRCLATGYRKSLAPAAY